MPNLNSQPQKARTSLPDGTVFRWLRTGAEGLETMLSAIAEATRAIQLEMYIFMPDALGERFREALVQARLRGVRVQVLIDAFGSVSLPATFWVPLIQLGGEVRWFNTLRASERYGRRNHRKLLVADSTRAIVGGFNIGMEYHGDGVTSG